MASTHHIPRTPDEITRHRLQRGQRHQHTGYNGIIPADYTPGFTRQRLATPSFVLHIDCDCFDCKRERVETDL